ncbi:MAG: hypothetical protein COA78_31045 [Blastopirellula sp.]|nr:MAG: hypothetical protein COA78_31045 [Blastopirellula sp.]
MPQLHSPKLRCLATLVIIVSTILITGTLSVTELRAADAGKNQSEKLEPITVRFADPKVEEAPDFQRHVTPLMVRLGCNGRACHGSFQGRGDFQLSLFGYDFKYDHDAITAGDSPRVDLEDPEYSMIVYKPLDEDAHEGGQRFEENSWEHRVLLNWVKSGAKFEAKNISKIVRLEVTPEDILFSKQGDIEQLTAIAIWEDGTREDVTPLCRFTTNNEQVAKVDIDGKIESGSAGDTHVVVAYDKAVVAIPVIRPTTDLIGNKYPQVASNGKIDDLVVEKLQKLGIVPSAIANDEEFLRRLSLDMAGTLPTPQEITRFVADKSADKRAKKVEELLETPAYVAKWTTMLCDITGNNDAQLTNVSPVRTGPSQEWYDWIERRVKANTPYDEIVEGFVLARSRNPGDSYKEYCEEMSDLYREGDSFADRDTMTHYWARRDFRQPEDRAIGFAYAFMGVRIQCAQCHKHPFDVWSKQDFDEFKTFFTQAQFLNAPRKSKDESDKSFAQYQKIVKALDLDKELRGNQQRREFGNKLKEGKTVPFPELVLNPIRPKVTFKKTKDPKTKKTKSEKIVTYPTARLLGEAEIKLNEHDDIRSPVMEWLRKKDNRYFSKAFVNRIWASYFNVGIVEPADNLALGNPPSNEALLDYLAQGFVESGYDMKWVHREIVNSATYQRTWKPNDTNRLDFHNFSRAIPRRLPAEVAYDIVSQATSNDELFATYHDDVEGRTLSIPGTRPSGKTGSAAYGLQVFGRSLRESNCDCDRSMEASLLQTVYLQNDSDVLNKISGKLGWVDQLARELKPEQTKAKFKVDSLVKQIINYRKQMQAGYKKLAQSRKAGNKAQIKSMQKRLDSAKPKLAALESKLKEAKAEVAAASAPMDDKDAASIVEQAYLRTLSRKPTQEELNRSLDYFQESKDPVEGARDLLWVLLNTKEFIVNH